MIVDLTKDIVQRLKASDKSVMGDVYDAYADTLFGILQKIVRRDEIAEDILQETFVKVWLQREKYDTSKGTFFTWMLNIARNMAIDTIRSSGYKMSTENPTVDEIVGIAEPESDFAINPDTADVKDLVQNLLPEQRHIIELVYFKGYTQAEVAEEFGIPLGTVKSRVRLAMQNLRTYYDERT